MNLGINMRQSQNNVNPPYGSQSNHPNMGQPDVQQSIMNAINYENQSSQMLAGSQQHSQGSTAGSQNFKVVIRVRPPLKRELVSGCQFRPVVRVSANGKSCAIMEYLGAEVTEKERQKDMDLNPHLCVWQNFSFDYVYDERSTQENVYENTAKQSVISVLEGYNATVLAYGQTGTGKTHTMEGFKYNVGDPQRGIIPRSMEEIFKFIQMQSNKNTTFMVRVSYLQIYNEIISDLLKVERTSLQIREDKKRGVFVEGLSEWAVRSPNEVYALMQKGAQCRATATTKMNDLSSRSHAVFIIIVEQMTTLARPEIPGEDAPKQIKVGKLNLVDLAGSERVRVTQATGQRLEESKKINQSLSALGNVIAALTDHKARPHIPYRDSKLTRILEDSLGGNCKTTMMAMISPAADAFGESQSTLKFATRAKKIKNEARINEDVDQKTLVRKYEIELRRLKQELDQRNSQINSSEQYQRLEEERKKAELDKNAAICALEVRSREFLMEKEQKKLLEQKIFAMNSQMLIGGKKIEDTPQFRNALEEKQRVIRKEYDEKMQEIEKERIQIEEDKQQVDRYKQLLLKQRDIMIALTGRLNERDETIIQLQEELDAYDRINRETELFIDQKNYRIEQLEQFISTECKRELPPMVGFDQNGQSEFQMRNLNQFQERKYPPHQDQSWSGGQNQNLPMMLMTADEKIAELQQILEAKDLENDELKLQAESQTGQSHQGSSSKQQLKEKMMHKQQMRDIMTNIQIAMSNVNDLNNQIQYQDGQQSVQQQQKLSQMLIQKMQTISQIVQRSSTMEQHGGSSNNIGSMGDNVSQSDISISSSAGMQPQSRPTNQAMPHQQQQQYVRDNNQVNYQQLHPNYSAQGQYLQQPNQNMYGPDGSVQPQQSQSPKPPGHDNYDQAQAQQQLLRTQSQSSNSQYGLTNNKASIASSSSASNHGNAQMSQQYGQQKMSQGVNQGHMPGGSQQQWMGSNISPQGGYQMAAYQQQQQQQELQKKRQTMPESVSEMLRKRQMQKMRGSDNPSGHSQQQMNNMGQYKRY